MIKLKELIKKENCGCGDSCCSTKKESINEANPEAMVGKKLGTLLKSLDKTVAQYKKKANVKNHMNFFEAGVKNVMRKHGIK